MQVLYGAQLEKDFLLQGVDERMVWRDGIALLDRAQLTRHASTINACARCQSGNSGRAACRCQPIGVDVCNFEDAALKVLHARSTAFS